MVYLREQYFNPTITLQDTMLKGYRTPLMRPSPGSSPNLTIKPVNHLDMNHSAPCSPLGIMQKQTE